MNDIAAGLDTIFNGVRLPGLGSPPPRIGFVLLTFEFNKTEDGRVNYISNGERSDMIAAMKEWLARAEGRYHEGSERVQ